MLVKCLYIALVACATVLYTGPDFGLWDPTAPQQWVPHQVVGTQSTKVVVSQAEMSTNEKQFHTLKFLSCFQLLHHRKLHDINKNTVQKFYVPYMWAPKLGTPGLCSCGPCLNLALIVRYMLFLFQYELQLYIIVIYCLRCLSIKDPARNQHVITQLRVTLEIESHWRLIRFNNSHLKCKRVIFRNSYSSQLVHLVT